MPYGLLADLVVIVHFAYVAFVVVGLALILVGRLAGWDWVRNPWFRGLHLLAIGIVVVEAALQVPCPLTVWERDLRELAGQQVSDATFVARLVRRLFMCPSVPFTALAPAYFAFGAVVLLTFVAIPPRWRRASADAAERPAPPPV